MQVDAQHDTDLLTYTETAEALGVSKRTVHRYREDGLLTPVIAYTPRNATSVRFRRDDVQALASASAA